MPNYYDKITQPLIPKGAIQGLQGAMDPGGSDPQGGIMDAIKAVPDVASGLWNHPRETLGGMGAGVLEGARQQSTPVNIAAMIPAGRLVKGAQGLMGAAREAPAALEGLEIAAQRVHPKFYDPEAEYAQFLKNSAKEHVEEAAKLRGTPADTAHSPAAQALERLRVGGGDELSALDRHQNNTYDSIMKQARPTVTTPNLANRSVKDLMNPQAVGTMDKMFEEANPVFRDMQAKGMFNRGR